MTRFYQRTGGRSLEVDVGRREPVFPGDDRQQMWAVPPTQPLRGRDQPPHPKPLPRRPLEVAVEVADSLALRRVDGANLGRVALTRITESQRIKRRRNIFELKRAM